MMSMSSDEREAYLAEEAKRAKRNHKIFLLSKNNGLMTPQDKNFITRIQLQQLLTATGGIDNEPGSEEQIAEDFYYQVYAQIRGPPRSGPGQPLNQFAQTYLFQTGSRYGYGRSRHHPKGGDNHVQRMEQQVARAVEAAKARPKNKSLVVEGSLGKIAFSNSKTPRPLLNIKRPDSENKMRGPAKPATVADRKAALRDIESLYSTLMKLEDHERKLPPPPNEDSPPDVIEGHMRWRTEMQELNRQLWEASKVMESPPTECVTIPGSEISC
jgi:DNA topoisomerase 2-associated protein PAT1